MDDTYPLSRSIDQHMKRRMTRRACWYLSSWESFKTQTSRELSNIQVDLEKRSNLRKHVGCRRNELCQLLICEDPGYGGWFSARWVAGTRVMSPTEQQKAWWPKTRWLDWWIDHCNMNHISCWLQLALYPIPSIQFPWQHGWKRRFSPANRDGKPFNFFGSTQVPDFLRASTLW